MKEIKLTQGKSALVDDCDYAELSKHKWFTQYDGWNYYAVRKINGKPVRMHNVLITAPKGMFVDHSDRNGLNNQRGNLRICSHAENMRNVLRWKMSKTSPYKGVCWKEKNRKWVAQIRCYKVIHLGLFSDSKLAAIAYDNAATHYFGEFALTNRKLGLLTDQPVPEPTTVLKDA